MERKDLLYLGAFALLLFLFGSWLMPVTDPVESNYVETAKEMIAAGDYLSPRIFGNYWYDKPILFYWERHEALRPPRGHLLGGDPRALRRVLVPRACDHHGHDALGDGQPDAHELLSGL